MFRVCFLVVWIAAVCFAGKWSEWHDASLCTAKPCGCPLENPKIPCGSGHKIQIRYCNHTGSDVISPCAYDEHKNGPIQKIECKATSKNCPGWSEWEPITDCICEPYKEEGRQQMRRLCNNPAPIYGDKLCAAVDGTFIDVEKMEKDCTCTITVGTTTTTTEKPDKRQCCCEIEGWNKRQEEEKPKGGGLLGDRRRRSENTTPLPLNDYCDDGPECCKDEKDKPTTTVDYKDYDAVIHIK